MLLLGRPHTECEYAWPAALWLRTLANSNACELAALSVRQHLVALSERASCLLDGSSSVKVSTSIHQKTDGCARKPSSCSTIDLSAGKVTVSGS